MRTLDLARTSLDVAAATPESTGAFEGVRGWTKYFLPRGPSRPQGRHSKKPQKGFALCCWTMNPIHGSSETCSIRSRKETWCARQVTGASEGGSSRKCL